jgi:hypothetical protein
MLLSKHIRIKKLEVIESIKYFELYKEKIKFETTTVKPQIKTKVVGITFGNRINNIKQLEYNSIIKLKRDYKNKYHKNAIELVDESDVSLGYISKKLACILADRLDDWEKYIAEIDKIINNRRKTSLSIKISKEK